MRRQWLRSLAAVVAAPVFALTIPSAPAQADPGVLVFPGMEIHQGSAVCTLGFVDPVARTAFTAGHCRGNGPVVDRDSKPIGTLTMFRDNTPDGATVATDHMISDWEAISIAPDVAVNDILPGGRILYSDPGIVSDARPWRLPFRRGHRGELRKHRGGQQRLVHDGQRHRQPEGRFRRSGVCRGGRRAGRHRRNVQQHVGQLSGGGVLADGQPAGQ